MHNARVGAGGVDPVSDQIVGIGPPAAGYAFEMGDERVRARIAGRDGAGVIICSEGIAGLVVDIPVRKCRIVVAKGGITACDPVAINTVGGRAYSVRNIVGRVAPSVDVVDECLAGNRTGVVISHHLVAKGAVRNGVKRRRGVIRVGQIGQLLPRRCCRIIEIAQVIGGRGCGLIAAHCAQHAGLRAEAGPIGGRADGAGKIHAIRRGKGQGRPGFGRQIVQQPACLACAGNDVIAHDGRAADAGHEGR